MCEFHKIPWHNSDECHSKRSLLAEKKSLGLDVDSEFDSMLEKGIWIIYAEPSVTIIATKFHPEELEEPKEGENIFHSQMWVKGTPLHFIVDSDIHNKFIST
jgi:hypothetical protein